METGVKEKKGKGRYDSGRISSTSSIAKILILRDGSRGRQKDLPIFSLLLFVNLRLSSGRNSLFLSLSRPQFHYSVLVRSMDTFTTYYVLARTHYNFSLMESRYQAWLVPIKFRLPKP